MVLRYSVLTALVGLLLLGGLGFTRFETGSMQDRQSPIEISKETTVYTEPLDENGYLLVVEALRRHSSEGVTRDNNAAVLWLEAIGFRAEGTVLDYQAEQLGSEIPPDDASFFRHGTPQPGPLDVFLPLEQLERVNQGPWGADECPEAAEWIEENEAALALVAEAVKRPRFYVPREGDHSWSLLLPDVQSSRSVARCLIARAYLRMEQSDYEGAWDDILTTYRLGRMSAKGAFLIESLVGVAIDSMAQQATSKWLETLPVMAPDLEKCLAEYDALGPIPRLADKVQNERLMLVDLANFVSQGNTLEDWPGLGAQMMVLFRRRIDWNLVLREAGGRYDRMGEIFAVQDPERRRELMAEFEEELRESNDAVQAKYENAGGIALQLFSGREEASKDVAVIFTGLIMPASAAILHAEDRSDTARQMTRLAFAIKAYQLEHGEFPASLDDLSDAGRSMPEGERSGVYPLTYRVNDEEVVLYQFGRNGEDDGGPPNDAAMPDASDDQGWRWRLR